MGELADLTPGDVALLEKQLSERESSRSWLGAFLVGTIVISGLVLLTSDSAQTRITVGFSGGVMMLILIPLLLFTSAKALRADLRDRKKEILRGTIDDKVEVSSDPVTYGFQVGGERHLVDVTTYTRYDKGQTIRIERAVHSRVVLFVTHEVPPLR